MCVCVCVCVCVGGCVGVQREVRELEKKKKSKSPFLQSWKAEGSCNVTVSVDFRSA